MVVFFALAITLVLVALVRAYTSVDDARVLGWSTAHGLVLTPVNRPMVHWYLRNARALRTWGVLAGLFLQASCRLASGPPTARPTPRST